MKASFYVDFTNTEAKITRKEFETLCKEYAEGGIDLNNDKYAWTIAEFEDGELFIESHLCVDAIRAVYNPKLGFYK